MRHKKSFNHLGRTSAHRKAMLSNMASSLILHKRITTTVAKAKALRAYVEPLITKAKEDTTHSRRVVFSYLQDKEAVTELFREISKKVGDRPGGYTRILKLGNRQGDNADMAFMELVDYNENLLAEKDAAKAKSKRSRRGGKKKTETPEASVAETTVETAVAEEEVTPVETETEEAAPEAEVVEETVAEAEVVEEVKDEEPAAEPEAAAEEKAEVKDEAKNEKPAKEEKKAEDNEEEKK